jgi:hypothetical protein
MQHLRGKGTCTASSRNLHLNIVFRYHASMYPDSKRRGGEVRSRCGGERKDEWLWSVREGQTAAVFITRVALSLLAETSFTRTLMRHTLPNQHEQWLCMHACIMAITFQHRVIFCYAETHNVIVLISQFLPDWRLAIDSPIVCRQFEAFRAGVTTKLLHASCIVWCLIHWTYICEMHTYYFPSHI